MGYGGHDAHALRPDQDVVQLLQARVVVQVREGSPEKLHGRRLPQLLQLPQDLKIVADLDRHIRDGSTRFLCR